MSLRVNSAVSLPSDDRPTWMKMTVAVCLVRALTVRKRSGGKAAMLLRISR